jgi:PAS domain S-box-containing protein
MHILLIEDNPGDRRLVIEMLKECTTQSFVIESAVLLEEGLGALKHRKFDVVLSDLNLPDSIGLSGIERITTQNPGIPVIVLTSNNDEIVGIQALQKHAADYLVKGQINTDILVRTIRYSVERKKIEAELWESKEWFQTLVNTMPQLTWIADADGYITWYNEGWYNYTGTTIAEMEGKGWESVIDPALLPVVLEHWKYSLDIGQLFDMEISLRGADGVFHPFLTRMVPFKNSSGQIVQWFGANTDITELKELTNNLEKLVSERTQQLMKAHAELERTRRMGDIGRLASTIAHELRNPLAAIKVAAYNLQKKATGPTFLPHLETINKKIIEGDAIIQNLLSFTRIKVGKFEPVGLRAFLEECISSIESKFHTRETIVKKDIHLTAHDSLEADPTQLRIVISNILDNAFQALPDGKGSIAVAASIKDSQCVISIADTGGGIAKEDLEKVFEAFFTTKSKGTGLGLAVCKELIDLHHGTIEIRSAKDKGSTFTITLPLHQKNLHDQ